MSSPTTTVPILFTFHDVMLQIPKRPEFTEQCFSVCIERDGKPDEFYQSRWFVPNTEMSSNEQTQAWTPRESSSSSDSGGEASPSSSQLRLKWSSVNHISFLAHLQVASAPTPGSTTSGEGHLVYLPKVKHPFAFGVKVSPRHPSMGMSAKNTSTRTWSALVTLDLALVANHEDQTLPMSLALSKAGRNDSAASSQVMKDVILSLTVKADRFYDVPSEVTIKRQLWPNFVSRFPFVFLFDQFAVMRRVAVRESTEGAGATHIGVLPPQLVLVEVVRKHSEAGLVRRLSNRVPALPELTQQAGCAQMDVDERFEILSLAPECVDPSVLSPKTTNLGRSSSRPAYRHGPQSVGSVLAVVDSAVPDEWLSQTLSSAPSASVDLPLRVVKLHLETDAELGPLLPRDSKRAQLQFLLAAEGGAIEATGNERGRGGSTWVNAIGAPLNAATQLYSFENFPETGIQFFHSFPNFVELQYRVRRRLLPWFCPIDMNVNGEGAEGFQNLCVDDLASRESQL